MHKRIHNLILRSGAASYAAFTLLEVLVAVAALAVLAVGVAAIFDTTGKTLKAGVRVSNFSAAAALIEQQLRHDISSMTREGFLVIRNQYAKEDPNSMQPFQVPLAEGVPGARPRRIDELMFFSKGKFRSVRSLLDPDFIAESESARIYYGHGRRMQRDLTPASPFLRPQLDDAFENEPNTFLGYDDPDNPNRFASDWILLRHVTLLLPPQTTTTNITGLLPPSFNISDAEAADSDLQIALQPAASTIFRSLNTIFPGTLPTRIRTNEDRPTFASGLVDIATIDLAQIRSVIATADTWPNTAGNTFFDPASNQGADGANAGADGLTRIYGDPSDGDNEIISRMQAWMDDAFPAYSMGSGDEQTRIRCEFAPTDYIGISESGLGSPELEYRRADQVMLTSFNFLPRCTEFIVEWSNGQTFTSDPSDPNYVADRAGEVVWFGMRRVLNEGQSDQRIVALPYADHGGGADTRPWVGPITVPFDNHISNFRGAWQSGINYAEGDGAEFGGVRLVAINAHTSTGSQPTPTNWILVKDARILPHEPSLFHGTYDAFNQYYPISNYFAWNDPTFDPESPDRVGGPTPPDTNGILDEAGEAAEPTIEWPWPKMIRVTLSLADPNDPSIEQTFQFVFDVPAGHEGR